MPQINSVGLRQRSLQLRNSSRRGLSLLKSCHCMLSAHKSKIGYKTQPNCETCQAKQTPEYYLLHWGKYEKKKWRCYLKRFTKKWAKTSNTVNISNEQTKKSKSKKSRKKSSWQVKNSEEKKMFNRSNWLVPIMKHYKNFCWRTCVIRKFR